MTLTANDIITRARSRYNATDDDFFTDAELMAAIYDAESILAKEGYIIEKTYTTPSIAGTRTYTLPVTTLGVKEVKYDYCILEKDSLDRDPKTSSDEVTGTPLKYATWENAIILYPTPVNSGSVEDDGDLVDYIEIRVYKQPDDVLSLTSTLDIPEEFKSDIINYILMHMAFKDQNLNLYDRLKMTWEDTVIRVKKQRQKRLRTDRSAKVRDTYFGTDTTAIRSGAYYL